MNLVGNLELFSYYSQLFFQSVIYFFTFPKINLRPNKIKAELVYYFQNLILEIKFSRKLNRSVTWRNSGPAASLF